ncbi:hypothetical protein JCM17846_05710 [Iodidimonas nitroreducens]|uniref:Uncharacterized protein n=1 Tax=Iodidimonas nitroreducens TaxID=1236968 RepID=A0A5A7N737_9PROT|nr:hypothetical protein JCM17846_05710 [Iodidimonas nitroreducens]
MIKKAAQAVLMDRLGRRAFIEADVFIMKRKHCILNMSLNSCSLSNDCGQNQAKG